VAIILMVIGGYFINGYWLLLYKWLSVVIILVVIDGYSIGGYWCLILVIILMAIGVYFVVSH